MSPGAPRVWVTRAEPGAGRTAARLRELGYHPIIAPVLKIERIEGVRIDLDAVAALAFTSINGVSAFAELSDRRDLPTFCVGDATADAARELGFTEVRSASGDVQALGRLIAAAAPQGAVLVPGAEQPAGDLGAAAGGSIPIRRLPVYRTVETKLEPPPACDAVLIHSPRAAVALRPLIEGKPAGLLAVAISAAAARLFFSYIGFDAASTAGEEARNPQRDLPRAIVLSMVIITSLYILVAISAIGARPLAGRLQCAVADRPEETALLAALQAALGKPLPHV